MRPSLVFVALALFAGASVQAATTSCVSGAGLCDASVQTKTIAAAAIGKTEIKDGAITNTKIADASVGNGKLQAKSVTLDKLADSVLPAFIDAAKASIKPTAPAGVNEYDDDEAVSDSEKCILGKDWSDITGAKTCVKAKCKYDNEILIGGSCTCPGTLIQNFESSVRRRMQSLRGLKSSLVIDGDSEVVFPGGYQVQSGIRLYNNSPNPYRYICECAPVEAAWITDYILWGLCIAGNQACKDFFADLEAKTNVASGFVASEIGDIGDIGALFNGGDAHATAYCMTIGS